MIRPYGPGKFNTILDSLVFVVSLDGFAEDIGDVESTIGHHTRLDFGDDFLPYLVKETADNSPTLHPLTEEEMELVQNSAGAILYQNDQGFVDVTYYDTEEELTSAWREVEQAWEQECDESD
jgi:hypothetical protein